MSRYEWKLWNLAFCCESSSDPSLSLRVPLERDNSEEFLKREARAAQLAEEIEASATYKARVALENDERTEEEKYTAVVRGERETHTVSRWDHDAHTNFSFIQVCCLY